MQVLTWACRAGSCVLAVGLVPHAGFLVAFLLQVVGHLVREEALVRTFNETPLLSVADAAKIAKEAAAALLKGTESARVD